MVLSNPATGICSARAYQLELFRPEVGTTAKGHWSVTFKDKGGRLAAGELFRLEGDRLGYPFHGVLLVFKRAD